MKNGTKLNADPNAPGLDEETPLRRRTLAKMREMTPKERFDLAVRAGIYTKSGKLTKPYRSTDENVSKYRPTD